MIDSEAMVGFRKGGSGTGPSSEAVREAVSRVRDPEFDRTLDELGMLGEVDTSDGVSVEVLLPIPQHPKKDALKERITEALGTIGGVEEGRIRFGVMPDGDRQSLAERLQGENPFKEGGPGRTSVIGIASGKGGVGKSMITCNVAASLAAQGHKVGVLDADIWGFSIPRMLGLRDQRPTAFSGMIVPLDKGGMKVISIGFFLESEEEAVVWRGPMLHKALEQFLTDVWWGKDLDYLVIDLPPGTGDISISLATFLPDMGIAVVTTPQPVAQKVAERAAKMTDKVKLKVLGVIENMTEMICEHCGHGTPMFGDGGGRILADTLEVPLLGQIPLTRQIRETSDGGEPFVWEYPDHDVSKAFADAAAELAKHKPRRRLPVMQIGNA